jgi:hypothetical protein
MKGQSTGPALSVVFVDYDNVYLSLKRKNDEAAKRFAKDAAIWLKEIETGRLITPTNGYNDFAQRRIVMCRCYGNPVPRRNNHDNSTDMNSFPFVRHHFLRAGFEAIDCPPLTAQLKNSADIRMVMDVRDLLNHETHFDEFIILSGDADFTPVLHRLRAHARRTVVFANDHTAAPYTAIADGEIREADLMALLLDGRMPSEAEGNRSDATAGARSSADLALYAKDIIAEVVEAVRLSGQPLPLEALADRAVRALGHDRTVGTGWGGAGTFRELLLKGLPAGIRMSEEPPYFIFDANRQLTAESSLRFETRNDALRGSALSVDPYAARHEQAPVLPSAPAAKAPPPLATAPVAQRSAPASQAHAEISASRPAGPARPPVPQVAQRPQTKEETAAAIQRTVAKIYEACQAPPFSPPEYRMLFEEMASEISQNGLAGSQTIVNVAERARAHGVDARRDDIKFVLEVVSEADPWFEQGVSSSLFSSRFRNFVVARCRSQGLNLSSDELDLIDAWFMSGGGAPKAQAQAAPSFAPRADAPPPPPVPPQPAPYSFRQAATYAEPAQQPQALQSAAFGPPSQSERWWGADEQHDRGSAPRQSQDFDDHDPKDLPRIARR